ncbi:MAG: hypothetical protein ABI824_16440 [Acidobacteriota bacterium]
MALAVLLVVLFVVVLAIVGFVFPPTKWLEYFYNEDKGVGHSKGSQNKERK